MTDTERNVQAWMKRESEREPEPASPARQKTPDSQRELDESRQGAANSQERLFRLQAEREADNTLHQLRMRQMQEPKRKAEEEVQLERDRKTFNDAARTLRSFAMNDANFNVIRQSLGPGFCLYAIQQALSANALQLSAPKQKVLDQWEHESRDRETHRAQEELAKAIRQYDCGNPAPLRAIRDRQRVEAASQSDPRQPEAGQNFPPLPVTWHGKPLDSAFIKACTTETHKLLTKRFGSKQLNDRLNGIN